MLDIFSFVTGGVCVKCAGFLLSQFLKRHDDKIKATRDLLRTDVASMCTQTEALWRAAVAYYEKPSSEGIEQAKKLKLDLQSFARQWNLINTKLVASGFPQLPDDSLIKFRQALTLEIDVERAVGLPMAHPMAVALHEASGELNAIFYELKYKLA
jgi:hypothetical protein